MKPRLEGQFQFVPGSATFCNGVVAMPGYAIAHATFHQPLPFAQAFEAIRRHLESLGRPMAALCGAELRIPQPLSFEGFKALNAGYIAQLEAHGLQLDGQGTMTRTNVAPEPRAIAPDEPGIHAFSYTVPRSQPDARQAFVGSGIGELRDGPPSRESIVRAGESSPEAMQDKARYVMGAIQRQMANLGVSWADVTNTNMYTVHSPFHFLEPELLAVMGPAARYGVHWFYSRPPIQEVEFEVDVRGTAEELFL